MLKKFKALEGLHGLSQLEWLGDELGTHSLVYGWNGTGKTTLSNILYCLENRSLCVEDFETVKFKIDSLDAGVVTERNISDHTLNLRVFNEQYVISNVHFDGTGSNPITMIGDANIKLLDQIENESSILDKQNEELRQLHEEQKKNINTDEILTDAARNWRQIAADLNITGDKYFGSVFKINNVKDLLESKKITKENLKTLLLDAQTIVDSKNSVKTEWTKIDVAVDGLALSELYKSANELLSKHIDVKQLLDIDNHEQPMQDWVEQGVGLHKGLNTCAFCTNQITPRRLEDLAAKFTDSLAAAHQDIDALIQEIDDCPVNTITTDSSLVMPPQQKILTEQSLVLSSKATTISLSMKELRKLLTEKKLYITDKSKTYASFPLPAKDTNEYNGALVKAKKSIEEHNLLVENIKTESQSNLTKLLLNCISSYLESKNYFTNVDINEKLDSRIDALNQQITTATAELDKKKDTINDRKVAVDKINGLLSNFFDSNKIMFKSIEIDGIISYQILRNGRVAKNLSEGEKSIIALAYFLVSLSSSSAATLKETTVVIDDPIDSQDSNFLFRTYGIIKRCTKDAKQVVVLTHSYEFFNLVRDWFSNTKGIAKSLLLIERALGKSGEEIKVSNLPPMLANYKTEYHYLFSKLYGYAYKNDLLDSPMVANVARKTLEYFSSFKWCCKDTVEFGERIQDRFLKEDATAEERAIGDSVYKFVNEYSHALDPFRPVNITDAEAKATALNTLKFINEADPEHYKALKKQCDKFYES